MMAFFNEEKDLSDRFNILDAVISIAPESSATALPLILTEYAYPDFAPRFTEPSAKIKVSPTSLTSSISDLFQRLSLQEPTHDILCQVLLSHA